MTVLEASTSAVGRQVLANLARHDLDGLLAGNFAGRLPAHAVSHHGDGQVREKLDVDGVFVVLSVVSEQRAFAEIKSQGHLATSFSIPSMLAAESTLFQQSICIIHAGIDNTSFGSGIFPERTAAKLVTHRSFGAHPPEFLILFCRQSYNHTGAWRQTSYGYFSS